MPLLDGFGVIREITPKRMPVTIFVTAFDNLAIQALEARTRLASETIQRRAVRGKPAARYRPCAGFQLRRWAEDRAGWPTQFRTVAGRQARVEVRTPSSASEQRFYQD